MLSNLPSVTPSSSTSQPFSQQLDDAKTERFYREKETFMQFLLFLASWALLVNGNKEMSFASMSPHTKFYFHIWAEALSPPPACHISSLGILEITSKSQKRFIFNSTHRRSLNFEFSIPSDGFDKHPSRIGAQSSGTNRSPETQRANTVERRSLKASPKRKQK